MRKDFGLDPTGPAGPPPRTSGRLRGRAIEACTKPFGLASPPPPSYEEGAFISGLRLHRIFYRAEGANFISREPSPLGRGRVGMRWDYAASAATIFPRPRRAGCPSSLRRGQGEESGYGLPSVSLCSTAPLKEGGIFAYGRGRGCGPMWAYSRVLPVVVGPYGGCTNAQPASLTVILAHTLLLL